MNFIVQAIVITIVNYDRNTFTVQTIGLIVPRYQDHLSVLLVSKGFSLSYQSIFCPFIQPSMNSTKLIYCVVS
jgi:hypothetical protein